ncbi:epididymal-specific lipocalin-12 [Dasypus novemcinctus]|uniref:epididymal-specific lipocalin-12 n=1 Tax=Dasypus novemcinctus TaxID=9361 RepID=UPI00265E9D25|nr:epididymal-specific lipocalin-12 [Dasypus novemcinctus]
MGPWRSLWVLLALLRALQSQTPRPIPVSYVTRARTRVTPWLVAFHQEQFQGEWYVLGLAGNSFRKEDRRLLNPYTATFELNPDNSFQVSYSMNRGPNCRTWSYRLLASSRPGHFTVDTGTGGQREDVLVFDSDYRTFAVLLSRKVSHGREVLRVSLLGRTWTLRPEAMDKFICLARAHHLSNDNIVFPEVIVWIPAPNSC